MFYNFFQHFLYVDQFKTCLKLTDFICSYQCICFKLCLQQHKSIRYIWKIFEWESSMQDTVYSWLSGWWSLADTWNILWRIVVEPAWSISVWSRFVLFRYWKSICQRHSHCLYSSCRSWKLLWPDSCRWFNTIGWAVTCPQRDTGNNVWSDSFSWGNKSIYFFWNR